MKNNKVLKARFGYTIGNYLLKGLSFVSIPIYTRLLSTSSYGAFNNFLTYESIFFIIVGCAIHSSYNSAHYKYELNAANLAKGKDYYTYTSTTIVFILISALIWLFVTNVFSKILINWLEMDRFSLNLLVIYTAASALITCFNYKDVIIYDRKDEKSKKWHSHLSRYNLNQNILFESNKYSFYRMSPFKFVWLMINRITK